MKKKKRVTSVVYFVLAGNQYLKVGYCANKAAMAKRMSALQTGCPLPMMIIAYIYADSYVEKLIHESLKEYESYGEWFMLEPDLMAKIMSWIFKYEHHDNSDIDFKLVEGEKLVIWA